MNVAGFSPLCQNWLFDCKRGAFPIPLKVSKQGTGWKACVAIFPICFTRDSRNYSRVLSIRMLDLALRFLTQSLKTVFDFCLFRRAVMVWI